MKKILIPLLAILSLTALAGFPPPSTKGAGDSGFVGTFKTDYGTIPVTRPNGVLTIGTIPITAGGTGSTNLGTGVIKATAGVLATGAVSLITDVSNILPIANGGTGSSTQNFVDLSNDQTISGIKTFNSTIAGSVTGNAGTVTNGVYTTNKLSSLSSTTSTELGGVISDETGTGNLVFSDNPTFTNLNIGTAAGNITGNAATVTTNANLTGEVTSTGNAATLTNSAVIGKVLTGYTSGAGTVSATDTLLQAIQKLNGNNATNANLTGPIASTGNVSYITSQTGTGTKFVVDTSPTLVTPNVGVASGDSLAIGGSLNANTIFDITTAAKASRPTPLMTTTQKNALTGVEGGMVFDSTLHLPYYYNGSSWQTTTGLPTYIPVVPGVSSGNVDTFSVSYGTTNATTVCSASPCSYLDQIGTAVSSVTRSGTGAYALNTVKTYSKLKCGLEPYNPAGFGTFKRANLQCSSCSTLSFATTNNTDASALDTVGTFICQGSY